jgi:hypothetical protein
LRTAGSLKKVFAYRFGTKREQIQGLSAKSQT